jgi:hypothetical protein
MKETFALWLDQARPFAGALACAVRGADGAVASRSWAGGFSDASLENALRCAADLFEVIQHNRIAPGRVRWVYGQALLHCERRADGTCFGVFTTRNRDDPFEESGLERMFAEFRTLGLARPVAA